MRAAGILKLTGSEQVTPAAFAKAFPDQSGWVPRLLKKAEGNSGNSVRGSLKDFLEYAGLGKLPPEYATMYLCIWGSSLLPSSTAAVFKKHRRPLQDAAKAYLKRWKMWPHPLTLLADSSLLEAE